MSACTINRAGEVRDVRSLIDDFQRNVDTDTRLDLLPQIAKVYGDDELPNNVRYWLALHLLRSHFTWLAPYLPAKKKEREDLVQIEKHVEKHSNTRWGPAHGGEYWMQGDITDAQFDALLRTLQERSRRREARRRRAFGKSGDPTGVFLAT